MYRGGCSGTVYPTELVYRNKVWWCERDGPTRCDHSQPGTWKFVYPSSTTQMAYDVTAPATMLSLHHLEREIHAIF